MSVCQQLVDPYDVAGLLDLQIKKRHRLDQVHAHGRRLLRFEATVSELTAVW